MKKITKSILAAAAVILMTVGAKATVHTVNNGVINGGQFTNLQTAIDAATAGDTIYVHGSPNTYGDITLNKRLTLVGAGYYLTGTVNNFPSMVTNLYLDTIQFFNGASGSKIIGIACNGSITHNWPYSYFPSNIFISRCYTASTVSLFNNFIIENSLLGGISIRTQNGVVRNNILGVIDGTSQIGTIASGVIFDHNIFNGSYSISNISYATFTNNIFFFCGVASSSWSNVNNCIFTKNMTFDNLSSTLPFGSNTGSGNIATTMPTYQFNNTLTVGNSTPWTVNWTLKATSSGKNAATDGTDIGIYGGSYPMKNLTGASNLIPQMTLMNISNTSIPLNGTLNVNFKSRKQN